LKSETNVHTKKTLGSSVSPISFGDRLPLMLDNVLDFDLKKMSSVDLEEVL
jgi:hypothetical protein